MDTNSNIPAQKKVVSVEILHLDALGYGPNGKNTRREWRAECLENLLAGKDHFLAWQEGLDGRIKTRQKTSFMCTITYEDGSKQSFLEYPQCQFALDFVGHEFKSNLNAVDYQFLLPSLFSCATIIGEARFGRTIFKEEPFFNGTIFSEDVIYSGAIFDEGANFYSAIFKKDTFFTNTLFSKIAIFNSARFKNHANFYAIKFVRNADFYNVTFSGDADFRNAEFIWDVDFGSSKFLKSANFALSIFNRRCHFENTFNEYLNQWSEESYFAEKVDFENATFNNVGHFERVRFLKFTPAFRGCKIDSTRLEFSDDSYFPKDENSDDAIKNISFLKRLAEEHGQTDQSLNFNAMELKAKRKQVEPQAAHWSFKVLTWLYEKVSDYGRSFLRPLLGYSALIVCSLLLTLPFSDYSQDTTPIAVTNRALCVPKDKEEAAKQLQLTFGRAAFEYAMFRVGGVLDFTDTGKQNNTVNCTLFGQPIEPPLMRAWGIFKGIASIALLFLAALGLRNKYRIK
jgi:Pentapeptide repeats (9 copies)